ERQECPPVARIIVGAAARPQRPERERVDIHVIEKRETPRPMREVRFDAVRSEPRAIERSAPQRDRASEAKDERDHRADQQSRAKAETESRAKADSDQHGRQPVVKRDPDDSAKRSAAPPPRTQDPLRIHDDSAPSRAAKSDPPRQSKSSGDDND